jgi:peptide/nickel transport system permease protein
LNCQRTVDKYFKNYSASPTLRLGLCAMIFLLAIALPWGILSAIYPDSWLDDVGRAFSFVSVSTPAFWMGLVFLYFFGVKLSWVPVVGNGQGLQIILPALTMALGRSGTCIRLLRTTMLDVLNSGYIRAARAKGLRERLVISRHALKNAILPVVTRLGGILGAFLGGSAIMETVFSWPGVGKYALESILYKDIPVIQGYVLFMAAMVVVINLFVDIIYILNSRRKIIATHKKITDE